MKKAIVGLLVVVLMLSMFTACTSGPADEPSAPAPAAPAAPAAPGDQDDTQAEPTKDGLVFKFIPMATASAYWQALKKGAEDAAAEFGAEWGGIEVQFDGAREDSDLMGQVDIINNSVAAGVDGLLIAPSSPTVPYEAIMNAVDQGVYVIIVDQMLDPMDAHAFFGTNCVEMTKNLADYMAKNVLDGTGAHVQMMYNMTSLAAIDRHDGWVEGITEFMPEMRDVGYEITQSDIAGTQTQVVNLINGNPDLKVVFAANDRSAIGALNAFKQLGIVGEIYLCNVDCNLDTLKAMREGIIQATALQMPYNQGYQAVQMILALMKGETVEKFGDSGSFLLTPENMDTPEAVAAIQQYLDGYKPEDSM